MKTLIKNDQDHIVAKLEKEIDGLTNKISSLCEENEKLTTGANSMYEVESLREKVCILLEENEKLSRLFQNW